MFMSDKKILYIDLDGVIVDFDSGVKKLSEVDKKRYAGRYKDVPGIFSTMEPMIDAIDAVKQLDNYFNIYILSAAPWNNPSAWGEKLEWVKKYFGDDESSLLYKKIILTNNKHLNIGDILIDDWTKNGADMFQGELIIFGSERFPNWTAIIEYLIDHKKFQ
jgi:5'(3')-deoxyribonucleotidase